MGNQASLHAVLMSVNRCGVLITGHPGIGKSSAALQLIDRQHQLVADDCVTITNDNHQLVGYAPKKIKGYLHVRGIGLINIKDSYGNQSILDKSPIQLVVELSDKSMGTIKMHLPTETEEILSVKLKKITLSTQLAINYALAIEILVHMHHTTRKETLTYD